MMWTTTVLLLLTSLLLSPRIKGNGSNSNRSEIANEDLTNIRAKGQKPLKEVKNQDTCTIPCDITAKLLRDEKHSICAQLQQSLLAFGRSTRKLMRDVMEEQQRALDVLSSQVMELMIKVQTLSSEVQRSNAETFSIKPVQSHDGLGTIIPDVLEAQAAPPPDPTSEQAENNRWIVR